MENAHVMYILLDIYKLVVIIIEKYTTIHVKYCKVDIIYYQGHVLDSILYKIYNILYPVLYYNYYTDYRIIIILYINNIV